MAKRPVPPPPTPKPASAATTTRAPAGPVQFEKIREGAGQRIGEYGPGGIGKTLLALTAPGPVAVFDFDDSLPVLKPQLEGLDVHVIPTTDWQECRDALHAPGWDDIGTIVIDSATKAEELAIAWTVAHVKTDKGECVSGIEGYGFGKGYQHVYDTFLSLLADLDAHARAGRNIILVMHDCTANVPNPVGEDYIRYEPRLQSLSSGKASIRLRVREWLDHLLFIGYDIEAKDGKGRGHGSRTIYPAELPHCMAKSRKLADPMPLALGDTTLWNLLFGE
jgi:hypothetical protein